MESGRGPHLERLYCADWSRVNGVQKNAICQFQNEGEDGRLAGLDNGDLLGSQIVELIDEAIN